VSKGRAASLLVGNRGFGGRAVSECVAGGLGGGWTGSRQFPAALLLLGCWLKSLSYSWSSSGMSGRVGWCRSDGDDDVVVGNPLAIGKK
jgi:hypothetical protein